MHKRTVLNSLVALLIFAAVFGMGLAPVCLASAPSGSNQGQMVAPLANDSQMGTPPALTSVSGITLIFVAVVRWVYGLFFIVAVLFFLFAAYNFMLGGSDEKKLATAKNQLKYGVIAVVVAVMAQGIIYIVIAFVSVGA